MAKMEASYEESESDDDDDIDETLETNRKLSAVPEETGDAEKDRRAKNNRRKSLHKNIEDLNKVKMGSHVSEHESVIQKR